MRQEAGEAIRQKADFITAFRETGGDVKESLRRARLDLLAVLNFAANDSAFRSVWETAAGKSVC
jgi:hypothetical protein